MAGLNLNPLRHHEKHAELHGTFGQDRFGVAAEKFARFLGTPKYLVTQTLFVVLWMAYNGYVALRVLHGHPFDPYPWILLNLLFSTQAAYAAPLILLAQTRAATRDKAAEEASAIHRDELANGQAQQLAENTEITRQIHGMQEQQMTILERVKNVHDDLQELRELLEVRDHQNEPGPASAPCAGSGPCCAGPSASAT